MNIKCNSCKSKIETDLKKFDKDKITKIKCSNCGTENNVAVDKNSDDPQKPQRALDDLINKFKNLFKK